jgi:exonuclease VII large subunit
MPETNIIQDGVDRFREAFGSIEEELERAQKNLRRRGKKLEKRFNTSRKDLEKRLETQRKDFEKRTKKLRAQIEKSPAAKRLETQRKDFEKRTKKLRVKRIEKARKDAAKQLEQNVSDVLGAFQIASKNDVQRIDRKISQLNRKLAEMSGKKRTSGKAQPTA